MLVAIPTANNPEAAIEQGEAGNLLQAKTIGSFKESFKA